MPKNVGVEAVDAVEEAAPARVHLAGRVRVRVVVGVDVPAVGAAPRAIASTPSREQLPERVRVVGAAREAAAHADDRDRLGCGHDLIR